MRRLTAVLALLRAIAWAVPALAQGPQPITYTLSITQPATHTARVEVSVPTGGRDVVELMMPVWSPGFYRVEDYAGKVHDLAARAPDGTALVVEQARPNRWTVPTRGQPLVRVSYLVTCEQR